jgi:hypothetical protein
MRARPVFVSAPLVLVLAALAGCAPEEPERFDVRVAVTSDEGQALDGVAVKVDDAVVGQTDGAGRLVMALPGPEGRRVNVSVDAPSGYRGGVQTRSIVLDRLVRRADGTHAPLEVETRFAPAQRSYVLLVDVGVPALPVEIFGVQKATTNSEGVAMLTVPGVPGDDLQVRVTRGARPDLLPAFVAHNFTLPDHASVCVLDGRFTQVKKRIVRARPPLRL